MQIERLFTKSLTDPYESCSFVKRPVETAGSQKTISVPESWSLEAAELLAESLALVPAKLQTVEENTLPSWLWQRRAQSNSGASETSVQQIFNRIAGAATYSGWKQGLLRNETAAHIFYDELRFILTHRYVMLDPQTLGNLGTNWAYGAQFTPKAIMALSNITQDYESFAAAKNSDANTIAVNNSQIDLVISGNSPAARLQWRKFLHNSKNHDLLTIAFADTASEWGICSAEPTPRLMIDLLKFYHADNGVDLPALQQAVKLSTIMLELLYDQLANQGTSSRSLSIGHCNLAALLMALGLTYDSEAARATAAALNAIITADATSTSAQLASLLGACEAFSAQRDVKLRSLRNQRRVAYGEQNDYERISILPTPLGVTAGANLVLVATARRSWDEALELAQQHGLRHLQLTSLFASPDFAIALGCAAQGTEPLASLVQQTTLQRTISPAVTLGLKKAKLDPSDIKAVTDYVIGHNTLVAAPGINHDNLRKRGFDAKTLRALENYLPQVAHISQAFTPWILGEGFCRDKLKLSAKDLKNPAFSLLKYLGYSTLDIKAANDFCCGHASVTGVAELTPQLATTFTTRNEITLHAQIRMAAAVQSFVSNDAGLILSMPANASTEMRHEILLSAWRQGVKSITIFMENRGGPQSQRVQKKLLVRKSPAMPPIMAQGRNRKTISMMTKPRMAKLKASSRSVALKRAKSKSGSSSDKRR